MKLRQSALQNKEFVDTIKRQTICMAGSDVAYNNLSDTQKAKGEYQFLKSCLAGTPHGIHQGIYMITPAGKLITRINWGWPTPDTQKMNDQLKQAIETYNAMSKSERLGTSAMPDSQRSMPKQQFITAPSSWLQLRNTSRSYVFAEMDLFDIRHPVYNKIDKLWYTDSEKLKLIPSTLTMGAPEKVDKQLIQRLLSNSHLILGPAAWWHEHIKQAEMSMTVKAKKGNKLLIHYQGDLHQDANSKWNQSEYKGTLLGKAVWDAQAKEFDSFTWVSLGDYTIHNLKSNMHKGKTKTVRIASLLELDPKHSSESDLTPFHWDHYPKEVRSQVHQ